MPSQATAALQNIALMVGALLLFSLGAEMVLRTTHLFGARRAWTTPDPVVGYRFIPGASYWSVQENDHPITGRINRFGWRDRDWILHKPVGTYRVAILGDSFVEGLQVETDSTFLALAERELSAEDRHPVELMNFGRSGYTQSEELLTLRRDVLQFNPDLVVLFFFPGNDITDVARQTAPNLQRPFFVASKDGLVLDTSFASTTQYAVRSRIDYVKRNSALVSLLVERYVALRDREPAPRKDVMDGYLRLCTSTPGLDYQANYGLNKRLIQEMSDVLNVRGIRFAVVALPVPAYMPEAGRRFLAINSTFDQYWFETDLSAFAIENGIGFVGLEKAFSDEYAVRPAPLNWHDIGHWTYAGHRLVARTLAGWLRPIVEDHFRVAMGSQ